jgi:hypothetical protein
LARNLLPVRAIRICIIKHVQRERLLNKTDINTHSALATTAESELDLTRAFHLLAGRRNSIEATVRQLREPYRIMETPARKPAANREHDFYGPVPPGEGKLFDALCVIMSLALWKGFVVI